MRNHSILTIVMPVYNGGLTIRESLSSIISQTFLDWQLFILDNQSSDSTQEIVNEFVGIDSRINLVIDDCKRNSHDAANKLLSYVNTPYFMIACDDDIWHPDYIMTCISCLECNPTIDLAYTYMQYIDNNGIIHGSPKGYPQSAFFTSYNSFIRVIFFGIIRQILPPLFGIYRTEAALRCLPFFTFDETIADVDTLFLALFLQKSRPLCVPKPYFYYRSKVRAMDPNVLSIKLNKRYSDIARKIIYRLIHEFKFTLVLTKFFALRCSLIQAFIYVPFFIIGGILREVRAVFIDIKLFHINSVDLHFIIRSRSLSSKL